MKMIQLWNKEIQQFKWLENIRFKTWNQYFQDSTKSIAFEDRLVLTI